MSRTRNPGEEFELTDAEILVAPTQLLSPAQLKYRKKLRMKEVRKRRKAARERRIEEGRAKVIYCQGNTRAGEPCQSYAVTGAKHCIAHLNDAEQAKLGKKTLGQYAGESHRLRAIERAGARVTAPQAARDVFEVALSKVLARYFIAIGMEFKGFDEEGTPIVIDHGAEKGLCLYGESKEGDIHVSNHPDLAAQIQIMEKLWDRIYGKPKQTNVLEGGTKPIQVQPVKSADRAKDMATLLQRSGALSHGTRRRAQPSEPPASAGDGPPANVVPLNDTES